MKLEEVKKYVSRTFGKRWADKEFTTPKGILYCFYLFAESHTEYTVRILRVTNSKCIEKIIKSQKGLMVSKWAMMRNYNDNLEHINGKMKIMDYELVKVGD